MICEVVERSFIDEDDGRMVKMQELKDLEGKVTKTVYIGIGPFTLPDGRVVPIQFGLNVQTIEEAMEQYVEVHKEAVKKQIEEMTKPRIVVPQGSVPKKSNILVGDFKK
jgi:hypothetical protein